MGSEMCIRDRSTVAAGVNAGRDSSGDGVFGVAFASFFPSLIVGFFIGGLAAFAIAWASALLFPGDGDAVDRTVGYIACFTIPICALAIYWFCVSEAASNRRLGIRQQVEQFDSLILSPSLYWFSDFSQDADHRMFSGQVLGAVDEITAKLDALLRNASDG